MNNESMNQYYKRLLNDEMLDSRKVGWRDTIAQKRRYQQLFKLLEKEDKVSIADLGCGLAGFYTFLNEEKFNFSYTGYELSNEMILNAKKKIIINHNSCKLTLIDNTKEILKHDFIIASGIFNMKQDTDDDAWLEYIFKQLIYMNAKSKKGFAFNLLTSYSDKKLMKDELYYANPCKVFNYCKQNFSRNVSLLHDYEEYDFTIIVRK